MIALHRSATLSNELPGLLQYRTVSGGLRELSQSVRSPA